MSWRESGYLVAVAGILASASFFGGCSDDSPTSGGSGIDTDVDTDDIRGAFMALAMQQDALLVEADRIAAGDFSGLPRRPGGGGPLCTDGAWAYESHFVVDEELGYDFDRHYIAEYSFQMNPIPCGSTPQGDAAQADQVHFHTDQRLVMPLFKGGEGTVTTEFDEDLTIGWSGGGVRGITYTIVGSGSGSVHTVATVEGQPVNQRTDASWTIDVALPSGGCPSGVITVTGGDYTVVTTYTGTASYTWDLFRGQEAQPIESGTGFVNCS